MSFYIDYYDRRACRIDPSQELSVYTRILELQKSCDGIRDDAKIGAVSFIQRFGLRLNLHLHFHCVVLDGVFYIAAGDHFAGYFRVTAFIWYC
jgi:hypothetical protein